MWDIKCSELQVGPKRLFTALLVQLWQWGDTVCLHVPTTDKMSLDVVGYNAARLVSEVKYCLEAKHLDGTCEVKCYCIAYPF